jgi:NAD(P)-dependent dehydrogenase (short-subunit alcohol dehydrogenase family)
MSTPVWFITAASSGFGKYLALEALNRGHKVVATARDPSRIQDLKKAGADTLKLDVTDSMENIKKVIDASIALHGQIDYLINAAGYILEGAAEEATPEETFAQFNTNVFGTLNVTRAALPYMRERRSGVIALFGSVGSWRSGPAVTLYAATKWACSGLAEGLKKELEPFGITVTVVEPGYFRTGFLNPGARVLTKQRLEAYDETSVGQVRNALNKTDNNQPGDVEKGCKAIVDVLLGTGLAKGKEIPVRIVLGSDCQKIIRDKLDSTISLLDEWKELSYSTDYPSGK